MKNKIYYLADINKDSAIEDRVAWIRGLNESGYAGIQTTGMICDRREFPDAIPVQENSMFGVVKPKELPDDTNSN